MEGPIVYGNDAEGKWISAWVECIICCNFWVAVFHEDTDEAKLECSYCGEQCSRVLCVNEVEDRTGREYTGPTQGEQ